jgi:uncharacterized damage-inducible protein DinB
MTDAVALAFVDDQRARFREMRRRLAQVLEQLSEADVNWRPNAQSNSVGNLVAHICGNLTQRYVAQLGGAPDARDRAAEFDTALQRTHSDLLWMIDTTFDAVDEVLGNVTPERLLQEIPLKDRTISVLHLINHTAAHAAEHVGQIIYIAKQRLGAAWKA